MVAAGAREKFCKAVTPLMMNLVHTETGAELIFLIWIRNTHRNNSGITLEELPVCSLSSFFLVSVSLAGFLVSAFADSRHLKLTGSFTSRKSLPEALICVRCRSHQTHPGFTQDRQWLGSTKGIATSGLDAVILEEKKNTFILEKGTVHLPREDEILLQFIVME